MQETKHFQEMLEERDIQAEWVESTVTNPDRIDNQSDGTKHYIKQISEYGDRWLRVIVNPTKEPPAKITAFFDRRLRRANR